MIQEDEKYKALRDKLKSLPRVKAKPDFESRLMQRIKDAELAPVHKTVPHIQHIPEKKSWFAFLFRPAFVPALGLTAVLLIAIVAYFAYYSSLQQKDTAMNEQFVSSTNQGDLIIYVKKDGENYSENYPKEYSALSSGDTKTENNLTPTSPTEVSTDYFAKPDPTRTISPDIKNDRVSEEQKIEMQRSVDDDRDKGVDVKSERKLDDGIMKKESKKDFKIESKGTLKSDTESPKKKVSDEKKNIQINEQNEVKQEIINEPKTEDDSEKTGKGKNRISRATKKDSTNNKSDSEAEDKESIQQK